MNYKHKSSNVTGKVPVAGEILEGEIAVNFPDKAIYTKTPSGEVVRLNPLAELTTAKIEDPTTILE